MVYISTRGTTTLLNAFLRVNMWGWWLGPCLQGSCPHRPLLLLTGRLTHSHVAQWSNVFATCPASMPGYRKSTRLQLTALWIACRGWCVSFLSCSFLLPPPAFFFAGASALQSFVVASITDDHEEGRFLEVSPSLWWRSCTHSLTHSLTCHL